MALKTSHADAVASVDPIWSAVRSDAEQIVRSDGPGSVGAVVERVRFRGSDADVTLTVGPTMVTARWRSTELADAGSAVMVRVTGPVTGYGVTAD